MSLSLLGLLGLAGYLIGWQVWALYHYHAAQRALEQRDFIRAQAHLALCLKVWPGSAATHLLASQAARRAGACDLAERHLNACEQRHGALEAVQLERALLAAQRGDLADVEGDLLSRIGQDRPETPLILEALIQGYMETYRLPEALACLEALLRRQPGHVQALLWRARVRERLLAWQEAEDDYRRAVELDPEHDEARLRLAKSLLESGQVKEAQDHFEFLSGRQPGNPVVFLGLARCWYTFGRIEEAERLLDRVLAANPRDLVALTERGKLALEAGKLTEAEKWLRQAVAVAPYDYPAGYTLYQCLKQRGEQGEARHCLERLTRIEADFTRFHEVTERMVTDGPHDPGLRYEAGVILLRNGKEQEGLHWLASALREDPGHRATHQVLADYYERTGKRDLAARHRQLAERPEGHRGSSLPPVP